nr:hypothetical protein [uncultured Mucilaginibacter sp.]
MKPSETNQKRLLFEISGEIISAGSDGDNPISLRDLNYERKKIEQNTIKELDESIKKLGFTSQITADIQFDQGSILVTGLIILDIAGKISGGIAFVEYIVRLIKMIVKRNIREAVSFPNLEMNLNVSPIGLTDIDAHQVAEPTLSTVAPREEEPSQDRAAFVFLGFKPASLILTITLLNVALFLGGAVYSGYQVKSIQQRYDEAQKEIENARDKYTKAAGTLKDAEAAFNTKLYTVDTVSQSLHIKKLTIEEAINNDKISLEQVFSSTKQNLDSYKEKVNEIRKELDVADDQSTLLNRRLNNLNSSDVTFSFIELWRHINIWFKIILIAVPLVFIGLFLRINKLQ